MPTNPAIKSQTTTLAYSDGGSPSAFTLIAGVSGISDLGGGAVPMNDTSTLDSTFREKMPGLPDEGTITITINGNPANAVQTVLRNARRNQTRLEWRVVFSNGTTAVFFGYVTVFRNDIAVGQPVRGSITIEIDGEVAWT